MPGDDPRQTSDRPDGDDYVLIPIGTRLVVWQWRVRVTVAASPVVLFVMADLPPLAVFALGFGTAVGVVWLAGRLASVEVRVRAIRSVRR